MRKSAKANVTPIRQRTQYSCMASSMSMALNALGHNTDEDTVNKVMGAAPMKGAAWEEALACAQHFGCRATLVVPSTLEQVKRWTDQGIPVMIAWNPEGREWSHASLVYHVSEGPLDAFSESEVVQGSGPGLYVWVADPNIPNPKKTTRIVHEDEFYGKWYEKWPRYLVRRPACAISREVTPEGRQVMAAVGWYHTVPEADSHLISELEQIAEQELIEATNPRDALEIMCWNAGYQGEKLPGWFRTLGKQLKVNVNREYQDGLRAGRNNKMANTTAKRVADRYLATRKPRPVQNKNKNENRVTGPGPKRRNVVVQDMLKHPGGAGRHHTRERDVERGHSRKPKHKKDMRSQE